jgi:hypothetical protein
MPGQDNSPPRSASDLDELFGEGIGGLYLERISRRHVLGYIKLARFAGQEPPRLTAMLRIASREAGIRRRGTRAGPAALTPDAQDRKGHRASRCQPMAWHRCRDEVVIRQRLQLLDDIPP